MLTIIERKSTIAKPHNAHIAKLKETISIKEKNLVLMEKQYRAAENLEISEITLNKWSNSIEAETQRLSNLVKLLYEKESNCENN